MNKNEEVAPLSEAIEGLTAIAEFYGISVSKLIKKHLPRMKEGEVILQRSVKRPARTQYVSYEYLLVKYWQWLQQQGEVL